MMRFKSKIFRIFNPVTQIFSFEKLSGLLPFDDFITIPISSKIGNMTNDEILIELKNFVNILSVEF